MPNLTHQFSILVLILVALSSCPAQANGTPSEEQSVLRPFRTGSCGGYSPDCYLLSGKIELAHRYVGANVHFSLLPMVFWWGGGSIKVYPGGAVHRRVISLRPYLFFGSSGSKDRYVGSALPGGGIGADIHVGASKKVIIQPSVSTTHFYAVGDSRSPSLPISGSLSVMRGF